MKPARLLLVDCPWRFRDRLGRRGAQAKYRTLTVEQLYAFELPPLAPDCLMLFWRVAAMQREALDVITVWGFEVKSELVWIKQTRLGNRHFGMGRYTRNEHETCLICTRGGRAVPVANRSIRSTFTAPVPTYPSGKVIHSAKPDEIYAIARRLVPRGPAVELFARRRYPGWIQQGDELPRRRSA